MDSSISTFYESGLAELQLIDLAQIIFLYSFMKEISEFKLKRELIKIQNMRI